jgi:hypothetical protein
VGDKDLVDEEFCTRRHQEILKKLLLHDIYLNGGESDLEGGIRYKTQILWGDYLHRKKTSMGWMDWIYRAVIGMMLTWISAAAIWLVKNIGGI